MKTKIFTSILIMLLINFSFGPAQASINMNNRNQLVIPPGLKIPITFKYPIDSHQLKQGNAVKFEVIDNVYVGNTLLFSMDTAGVAYIKSARKSKMFGRGGKIEISSGELTDVFGNKHTLTFSEIAKGKNESSAIILPIVAAGASYFIFPLAALASWGLTSTAPFVAASLITVPPALTVFKKGEEAQLSSVKVIFANQVSPSVINVPSN